MPVENVLLQLPNVAECAVLTRPSAEGLRRVAYVVPSGSFSASDASAFIRRSAPEAPVPDRYVLVTRLPIDPQGRLDEAALLRVPCIDDALAARAEQQLKARPEVQRVALFVEHGVRPVLPLHVSSLLDSGASRPAAESQPARAPRSAETCEPARRAGHPAALVKGKALSEPPDAPTTLPELLQRAAERFDGRRITYVTDAGAARGQSFAELLAAARRVSAGLQEHGLAQGQAVVLQLTAPEHTLLGFWGCVLGGFVPVMSAVPSSFDVATSDLERLEHVCARFQNPAMLTSAGLQPNLGAWLTRRGIERAPVLAVESLRDSRAVYHDAKPDPDATAFFSLTSGSTGAPKAIMLSHRNILARASGTNQLCGYTEQDRILNWLPFDHIGSISDWHLRCVQLGCAMFYSSKEYVIGDPLNWLRLMNRFRITRSWAPNFAYALLNDALNGAHEVWDLSCIAGLLTAGEAVSSRTVHAFLERLAPHGLSRCALQPAFGMAELGSGVTYYSPSEAEPIRVRHVHRAHLDGELVSVAETDADAVGFTSLGPIVPGASMRIVDDGGRVLPELCVGRLQIAGAPVCLGYYADPEANRRVFVGDGWFDTGDRGFISGGELYLTGRDKETLIVNGANYGSAEVEACAEEVDGVRVSFTAACAVRPRGASDERLAVFFSPTRTSERELLAILRGVQNSISKKTGVKPDYLVPLDPESIPKTAIGKLQRKVLARRFEAGEFDARVREADLLLENENTVPDWFLRPVWRARQLAAPSSPCGASRYWLVGDGSGLCEALARQLTAHGATVIRTPNAAHLPEESDRLTHVLDLRDYAAPEPGTSNATSAAQRRALQFAELGDQLVAATGNSTRDREPIRLFVVASHSQSVTDDADVIPARAMVPALAKALSQEHPAIAARHLDVPFVQDTDRTELAKQIALELGAHDKDDEVAYRAGQRLTRAFERVSWTAATRRPGLEREQLYVIIGGIGGIGVELGKYLLEKWRAKLLVVGRRPLPDAKDASSHTALARWRELEARGDVTYSALDVSDATALRRAVRERETALGLSVAGFFHLAGMYQEGPLLGPSRRDLAMSFAPKLAGTEAVHDLVRECPSAFVVCFSSLASVWSGSGIGAHAAANRLCDTVSRRERERGVRSYSLNWSVWKGLGIGAHSAPEQVLRGKGFHAIPPLKGMWSLEAILAREPEQFLIGVDCASPAVLRSIQGAPQPIAHLHGALSLRSDGENTSRMPVVSPDLGVTDAFGNPVHVGLVDLDTSGAHAPGELDRDAIRRQLRGPERAHAPPENPTQSALLDIWKRLLNVSEIGIDDSFFDLGGTSLLSVRLFSEVQRQLGANLSPGVLLHTSSVRGLSALIEGESAAASLDSLMALNRANGSPALFLLHDAEGQVEMYRELAEQLTPHLAVFGLRPHQRPTHPALHTRIEDMVAHYASRIRECQPVGPYCIGGWSSAGPLAVEVANALSAQGQRVAFVALLDAAPDGRVRSLLRSAKPPAERSSERRPVPAREEALSAQLKDAIRQQARHIGQRGLDYARVALLQRFVDHDQEIPWFLQHIPAKTVLEFALRKHRPTRFAGRLTLFRASMPAEERARTPSRQHDYGWSSRASSVRIVEVAGDHNGLLTAPHVARLAKEIRRRALCALAEGSTSRADKEPQSASAW